LTDETLVEKHGKKVVKKKAVAKTLKQRLNVHVLKTAFALKLFNFSNTSRTKCIPFAE
jgi:hypothetical protein